MLNGVLDPSLAVGVHHHVYWARTDMTYDDIAANIGRIFGVVGVIRGTIETIAFRLFVYVLRLCRKRYE